MLNITKDSFEKEVMSSEIPVVLDFWATWCGPCRMIAPIISEIAAEHPEIKVCKVNVDDEPALAEKFSIKFIPTLAVIKDGKVLAVESRHMDKQTVLKFISDAVGE